MPKPPAKLSTEEVQKGLAGLTGWTFDTNSTTIQKTFVRKNFLDAVAFIDKIAPIAEAQDHHPDILLSGYMNVKIMLSTHSAGGITQNDFTLATAIEKLAT